MPEGDNLFRAATALRKALQGSRVAAFHSDVPLVLRALEEKPLDGGLLRREGHRGRSGRCTRCVWVLQPSHRMRPATRAVLAPRALP